MSENTTNKNTADGGLSSTELLATLRRQIKEFESEETQLVNLLVFKRREVHDARIEADCLEYGIQIGSTVTDRKGNEFRITVIDSSYGKPWLQGNPRKKDGTWGIANRHLYANWEVSPANSQDR